MKLHNTYLKIFKDKIFIEYNTRNLVFGTHFFSIGVYDFSIENI